MHEMSVMNALMNKICQLAQEQKARRVVRVRVVLGALSHMSKGHFKEHFEIASKGTLAEGAHIDAEESEDVTDPNALHVVLKSIDVIPK